MLIAMAVYDTVENNRSWMTEATLESLAKTVDWSKHRLFIFDNGSCLQTQEYLQEASGSFPFTLLRSEENLGAAAGINRGWRERAPGEHCVRMDNDVVIHQAGWVDWMEEVFDRDPTIGICGLKRKDCDESPDTEGPYNSSLRMLPHEKGHRWLVVEDVEGVLGTCQGHNSALLDTIGYQHHASGLYGYDDSLGSVRARLAGFKRVFLHGFEIDHIDNPHPQEDAYNLEKQAMAAKATPDYNTMVLLLESGVRPLYYDGGFDDAG